MNHIDIRLQFRLEPDARVGPGKIQLLESVAELGSISAAARAQGMTYRRAWDLIDQMSKAFGRPMVTGHQGATGGSELTDLGREVITAFRRIEAVLRRQAAPTLAALDAQVRPQATGRARRKA